MVFIFMIASSILGYFLYEYKGALVGAGFGLLLFISYQLEIITSYIKKQQNTSDKEPDI
ncbi:hypothetical protein [Metabacillus fastidiosus]|uniref:hypothetical protein n=1 Tax=Metabacillus fastidiosus TaxID=1458 RepID=UPI000A6D7F9C|nr:hypothetical protein [Metabacillus fastidiosus]MED4462676.1 hypothetical protein [Metabacillus fastidiosus]